jgi:hypothetical protein
MKALPKRKGNNTGGDASHDVTTGLNESPYEKAGKWSVGHRGEGQPQ